MGQILSQPVTQKHSSSGENKQFSYGLSSMQGWRVNMEDAHTTILNLSEVENEGADLNQDPIAFFAVYDGHGGDAVAKFSGDNLFKIVAREEDFKKGDYSNALKNAFLNADIEILKDDLLKNDHSGCTATTILINDKHIVCANSGDSRTVLSINGDAKPLSYDHKPTNEGEKARICAAGGFVEMGRVNGNLALSRAIGDFEFKKSINLPAEEQIVTALPDIIEHELSDDDEFVVLACDGIWDCLTSQQVVEVVRRGIHDGKSLQEISEGLIDICLAPTSTGSGIGCDNMSVIIVAILNGKTLEEWYKSITDKEGTPVSESFDVVANEIYKNDHIDGADSGLSLSSQDQGLQEDDNDPNGDGLKTSFSIQQLLEHNVLTNQNGVFYLDSANLLSSLGALTRSTEATESEEEEEGDHEEHDISEVKEDDTEETKEEE